MPSASHARATRTATSPRFAIRIRWNSGATRARALLLEADQAGLGARDLELARRLHVDGFHDAVLDHQHAAAGAEAHVVGAEVGVDAERLAERAGAVGEHDDLAERVVLLGPRLHDPRVVDRQARHEVHALRL